MSSSKRKEIHKELGLAEVDDDSNEGVPAAGSSKKAKVDTSSRSFATMPNGDIAFTIDKLKKVTIGTFKGKVHVNIREW